jgi:hypothetical protein
MKSRGGSRQEGCGVRRNSTPPKCVGGPLDKGKCRDDVAGTMTLRSIIRRYLGRCRPQHEDELWWFRAQSSLENALRIAGRAQDHRGKRYSHQRRIKAAAMAEASQKLVELHDGLQRCSSFHELWMSIRRDLGPIPGIGELYIYDCALRIGAYKGLTPERVYLHAGTRIGAQKSGLLSRSKDGRNWLMSDELPVPLRELPPSDVENLLCIYKKHLPRLKSCQS